jgi:cell fate regulator YaaT (PSP1 superfamily)
MDNVTHPSQVQFSPRPKEDGEEGGKQRDSQPKLIYRHADPEEVNMLLDKARDEAKCLSVVQAKVRQKGLPMEVVDAEYQWYVVHLSFIYFIICVGIAEN